MSTKSKTRNRLRSRRRATKQFVDGGVGPYAPFQTRRDKRAMRKAGMMDPVYDAYNEGQALAELGPRHMPYRLRANPYPPGRRHEAFETGYRQMDPMGAHHGKNY